MKKILVVEDDLLMLRVIELILKNEGYATELVHNGREAAANLRMHDYDLVIIDLRLPFENLKEMVDGIRESQARKRFPVMVMIVSTIEESYISNWFGIQADAFLHKPFEPEVLAHQTARLLAGRWVQD